VIAEAPIVLEAEFLASAEDVLRLPPPVFAEVAFAGKSNVGKSSLINALVGRKKLARTSSTPGCTRKLIALRIVLREGTLDLIDLPGYGYAKVSKAERRAWGPMIERFLVERVGLRCVIVIVDVRRGLQPEDRELLEFLAHHGRPALLVATKTDKLPRSRLVPALQALRKQAGCPVLPFSAQSRSGREELWAAMLDGAGLARAS
jgi:GTP-binding protein